MSKKLRSFLLNSALFLYNTVAFSVLNIVMWRNDVWNQKKWTKIQGS